MERPPVRFPRNPRQACTQASAPNNGRSNETEAQTLPLIGTQPCSCITSYRGHQRQRRLTQCATRENQHCHGRGHWFNPAVRCLLRLINLHDLDSGDLTATTANKRVLRRILMDTSQQVADAAGPPGTALGARDAVQQRSTATVEPEPQLDGRYQASDQRSSSSDFAADSCGPGCRESGSPHSPMPRCPRLLSRLTRQASGR
jgi:hypothetical protein